MKLQTKLTITTLGIFIVAILFVGVLTFSNYSDDMKKQVNNQLLSISHNLDSNILTFIDGQKDKISLIANQQVLTDEELNQMLIDDPSFYDFFVIDSSGMVVQSSNQGRIGLYMGDRDYFTQARNQTYVSPVYFALVPKEYSIAVSTPFHGGVLVGAMKISVLNGLVSDKTGLGETGESLLAFVDENGDLVYFTPRKFSNQTIEVLSMGQASNRAITRALHNEEKVFSDAYDYRGVSVLAATQYVDELKIGLVSKIDVSEAFDKVYSLEKIMIFLIVFTILIMSIVVFIISRQISRELADMTSAIGKITKGDLAIQLKNSSVFEIQNLIESLNRILASLKLAILRVGMGKEELGLGEVLKAKEEVEEKYDMIFKNATDQIFIIDDNYKFVAANDSTIINLHKKPEEIIGKSIVEVVSKDVASQFFKNVKSVFQTGNPLFTEEKIALPGEKTIWASTRLNPIKDSNGKIISVMGIVRDITDIKMTEEKYKTLYKGSGYAIMILEPPIWKFTAGNPATLRMFGLKDEEQLKALSPGDVSPKVQPDGKLSSLEARKMIEKAMNEGSARFEWMHRRYHGETFPAEVLLSKIKLGDKEVLQAVVEDLTEFKKAEVSRERLAAIVDSAEEVIISKDLNGIITSWNKSAEKIYGWKGREVIGKSIDIIVPRELRAEIVKILNKIKKGEKVEHYQTFRVTKYGKRIKMSLSVSPVKDEFGNITGASVIGRKID